MKKNYFRKSIAILMALILVIWLPCGALGEGEHALTVSSGSGSGNYVEGAVISITADDLGSGITFDKWTTSAGGTFESETSSTTNFTMPANDVTVTAIYKYSLKVDNNDPIQYYAGETVSISAVVPDGAQFAGWTGLDNVIFVGDNDATKNPTSFTMPAGNVAATSKFKYYLTINNGSGEEGYYAADASVEINANNRESENLIFDKWTTSAGGSFTSETAPTTNFTMPGNAVTVEATYKAKVATPTFSVAAGTYTVAQSVEISCATDGATIHYTIDGTEPTASSPGYTTAIPVTEETVTIKAIAVKENMADSAVAETTYKIQPETVATPTFSVAAGTYTQTQSVEINCTTDGSTIHYTTDGTIPTANSEKYSAAIPVTEGTVTIKAIAVKENMLDSAVAEAAYTISASTASDPVKYAVTVENGDGGGSYEENATVTIKAKDPESGKQFDKWTTNDGVVFADASAKITTFKMLGKNVKVTANYKPVETQGSTSGNGGGNQGNSGSQSGSGSSGNSGSQGSSGSSGNSGSQSGSGNTQSNPPASGSNSGTQSSNPPASGSSGSATPAGAQTNTQTTDNKVGYVASDDVSNNNDSEAPRDPNKTYAPDGSEYNPDTGDTDKTGLKAVSGGAQGPSFNILDPVKTTDDTYKTVNRGTGSSTVSTGGSSGSGPVGAVTTSTDDTKKTTDETKTDEKTSETALTDNTYSIAGGYNVMLIGVSENNTLGETWPLILQRGIVFEGFGQGENGAEDTEGLLQTGMEGIRKEEDPGYWDAPSAVANAEDMILQFGFYEFAESEKKETDMDVLVEAATRLADEGMTMNARGVPFFMEVQLMGTTEEIDILRQLITELEINGYGGNTVLIFAQTGKGAEKKPLVIIHPAISSGMTVTAPMKTEDVLATVLSLSGQATEKQLEILNTLPGQNLLTTEELSGIVGLVPEPKTVEETTAEETEKAGLEGETDGAKKLQIPEGFGKNGTLDGNEQEKNRMTIERMKVTTNSGGQGSGTESLAPGSDVQKSEGPGGDGNADESLSVGPGGSETDEVSSAGPGGSGETDDSSSAGPGGTGTGEVSSDGPGHP